ncbi:MAG TPA: AAA family ATPase, partial [Candidatus Goldiibacteriota bacterium]|nr:AAA family ATPase [Candidatus Goldiibacteriota bacterium]
MLVTLRIKNYALLRDVEVSFGPGLNVLTGETGAGKSIVIGALNIAAGERGYTESIRTGEEKAVIEAVFDLSNSAELKKQLKPLLEEAGIEDCGDSLIIKRELNRAAKGRIWVNNSPASLAALEKIGKRIIDIHGQHEHQSLLRSEIHMDLLDSYAGTWRLREKAGEIYSGASALNSEIEGLKALEAEKAARLDLINYRIKEIEEA